MYVAIMNVEANRVAKLANFETPDEASEHVAKNFDNYPNAFVVDASKVAGPVSQWWVQGTNITIVPVPPTPEEQKAEADAQAKAEIKVDAFVRQFINMTPAQVSAYINTNVTSLATAKPVIEKLALMVLLLARREFR